MTKKPTILLTNDDGIHAPGIKHLANYLSEHANLVAVAPDREQSAVGLSITIRKPLQIEKISWSADCPAWGVDGTPADCVKMALNVIMEEKPDLIISGLNRGSNAGRNILYSGTVAGAIEGAIHDIPSMAVSCYDYFSPDYATAEPHIAKLVDYALKHPLPRGTLLNVNFPSHTTDFKGFKLTKSGLAYWKENPAKRDHPNERLSYYWLGSTYAEFDEEEDCDISWLRKGYMTAVPAHINQLADLNHLENHRSHFENHFTPSRQSASS